MSRFEYDLSLYPVQKNWITIGRTSPRGVDPQEMRMPYKAGMIVKIKLDAFKDTTDDQLICARGMVGRLVYRRGYQGSQFIWDWVSPDGYEIELNEGDIEQIIREPVIVK